MSSITDVFSALDAALESVGAIDWDGLAAAIRVSALERLETARRLAMACSHDIAAAVDRCGTSELGGAAHRVIADVLRISPRASRRRLRDAEQLAPRTTLTGQSLPAELPATAKAWNAGLLDGEHLKVI